MNWYELQTRCVEQVAMEIARPRCSDPKEWPQRTREAMNEARLKINAMTNMELLDLLAGVMGKALNV